MPDSSIIEGNSSFPDLPDTIRVQAQADTDKPGCTGPGCFFGHATTARVKTHEVILQVLNRWFDYGDKRVFYSVDNFAGTGPAWDVTPLIYAQAHPDHNLVTTDLDAALKSVKTAEGEEGRLCGSLRGVDVFVPGQPRLSGNVAFTDPDIEKRYKNGELSLSTAFECQSDPPNLLADNSITEGKLAGKVTPNHVLVFRQDDQNQPGDPGAMFLHTKEDSNVTEFDNAGRVISMKNASRLEEAIETLRSIWKEMTSKNQVESKKTPTKGEEDETVKAEHRSSTNTVPDLDEEEETMEKEDETVKAELDRLKTELDHMKNEVETKQKEIDTLTAEHTAMKERLDTIDKEQAEAEWKHLKETQIPPGWLKGDGKETEQRKEFDSDKVAYMHKILEHRKAQPTGEEGESYDNKGGDPKENKYLDVTRELRMLTGRMR